MLACLNINVWYVYIWWLTEFWESVCGWLLYELVFLFLKKNFFFIYIYILSFVLVVVVATEQSGALYGAKPQKLDLATEQSGALYSAN